MLMGEPEASGIKDPDLLALWRYGFYGFYLQEAFHMACRVQAKLDKVKA